MQGREHAQIESVAVKQRNPGENSIALPEVEGLRHVLGFCEDVIGR
jgi:hypothetical protein